MSSAILILITVCILAAIMPVARPFMLILPSNEINCFYENFTSIKYYRINYNVLRGGNRDINVLLKSPNGKILYKENKVTKGNFKFESSRGVYSLCFDNSFSTISNKLLYFDLTHDQLDSLAGEAGVKRPRANTFVEYAMENMHEHMTAVVGFQQEYRLRENMGRKFGEMMNNRMQLFSIISTVLILITGMGQVVVLRRFFIDKKTKTITVPT